MANLEEWNNRIFEGKESEATQVLRVAIIRTIKNVSNNSPKTMENNNLVSKVLSIL